MKIVCVVEIDLIIIISKVLESYNDKFLHTAFFYKIKFLIKFLILFRLMQWEFLIKILFLSVNAVLFFYL